MNRRIWTQKISKWSCPRWPCPVCRKGTLAIVKDSLIYHETIESKRKRSFIQGNEEFENFEITYSFTACAECKHSSCTQRFSIAGTGGMEPVPSAEDGHEWEDYFLPKVCYPMPDIIEFPRKCPVKVKDELRAAFTLFWLHPAACANRIRVALECLMDHFIISKQKTSTNGKCHPRKLHDRLDEFAESNSTMKNELMSLKWLGNTGSHEQNITKDELLTAFEIFEHALIELIDKHSASIAEAAQKLTEKHKNH